MLGLSLLWRVIAPFVLKACHLVDWTRWNTKVTVATTFTHGALQCGPMNKNAAASRLHAPCAGPRTESSLAFSVTYYLVIYILLFVYDCVLLASEAPARCLLC